MIKICLVLSILSVLLASVCKASNVYVSGEKLTWNFAEMRTKSLICKCYNDFGNVNERVELEECLKPLKSLKSAVEYMDTIDNHFYELRNLATTLIGPKLPISKIKSNILFSIFKTCFDENSVDSDKISCLENKINFIKGSDVKLHLDKNNIFGLKDQIAIINTFYSWTEDHDEEVEPEQETDSNLIQQLNGIPDAGTSGIDNIDADNENTDGNNATADADTSGNDNAGADNDNAVGNNATTDAGTGANADFNNANTDADNSNQNSSDINTATISSPNVVISQSSGGNISSATVDPNVMIQGEIISPTAGSNASLPENASQRGSDVDSGTMLDTEDPEEQAQSPNTSSLNPDDSNVSTNMMANGGTGNKGPTILMTTTSGTKPIRQRKSSSNSDSTTGSSISETTTGSSTSEANVNSTPSTSDPSNYESIKNMTDSSPYDSIFLGWPAITCYCICGLIPAVAVVYYIRRSKRPENL